MFGCDKYNIKPDLVSVAKVKLDKLYLHCVQSQVVHLFVFLALGF